ncbi:hypothetical protein B0H17DRAFT_57002 [Mycena rosella]|uniref:Uncharacterized protein n=1 Tax=Mycena rosella TaxID=1033263 RepID=A0AAD7D792_MYCRO|nr:hypothetical protein B0H17DRAFT_57002 [Mycena rosella]
MSMFSRASRLTINGGTFTINAHRPRRSVDPMLPVSTYLVFPSYSRLTRVRRIASRTGKRTSRAWRPGSRSWRRWWRCHHTRRRNMHATLLHGPSRAMPRLVVMSVGMKWNITGIGATLGRPRKGCEVLDGCDHCGAQCPCGSPSIPSTTAKTAERQDACPSGCSSCVERLAPGNDSDLPGSGAAPTRPHGMHWPPRGRDSEPGMVSELVTFCSSRTQAAGRLVDRAWAPMAHMAMAQHLESNIHSLSAPLNWCSGVAGDVPVPAPRS